MAPNTPPHMTVLPDTGVSTPANDIQVSFSHVHLYVDRVEDIAVYKELEDKLNNLRVSSSSSLPSQPFVPQNRDIVKQLLAGLGFRVTGARVSCDNIATNTRSVLVTSKDPEGVQFVITAIDPSSSVKEDELLHFDASKCNVRQWSVEYHDVHSPVIMAFTHSYCAFIIL